MSSSTRRSPQSPNGTNGGPVTRTAVSSEDALAQARAEAEKWQQRALTAEDALRTASAPRSPLAQIYSADFAEGVRLAWRSRHLATWRYQVTDAVQRLVHEFRHPDGRPHHPVARLTAVVRRRRFADGAPSPCCPAWGELIDLTWCPAIVWCPECGTHYRKA